MSKSLPYPEGLLSETLPSTTNKPANKAVLAVLKHPKERPCIIRTFVTIHKSIITGINKCIYYITISRTEFFEICNLQNLNLASPVKISALKITHYMVLYMTLAIDKMDGRGRINTAHCKRLPKKLR